MLTPLQILKDEIKNARETLEGTVADIKEEHLHKNPGGKASTLAGAYAHLISSEDVIVQSMLQGKAPLYETTFSGKTGASEIMPAMDAQWAESHAKWSKSVQLDLAKFREYAQAVYEATDEYLSGLSDEDVEGDVDLSSLGMGSKQLAYLLYAFIAGHTNNLAGEISAIKGVFGERGYPF